MFKRRGGHNVKEPDFFFCFLFLSFLFWLFFCLGGGGVACFSEETEGAEVVAN